MLTSIGSTSRRPRNTRRLLLGQALSCLFIQTGMAVASSPAISPRQIVTVESRFHFLAGDAAKTWTGATNSLWSNASNWTPTGAPTLNDSITFPTSAANYLVNNDLSNGGPVLNLVTVDGLTAGQPSLSGGFNTNELVVASTSGSTFTSGSFNFLDRSIFRGQAVTQLNSGATLQSSTTSPKLYLWDQAILNVNAGGAIVLPGSAALIAIDDAASLFVNAGGMVHSTNALIGNDQTAGPRSLRVDGISASMRIDFQTLLHTNAFNAPSGVVNIDVRNRGVFSSGIVEINENQTAVGQNADTNINVDNATFEVADAVGFENSYFYTGISPGPGTTTINLTNGGQFLIRDSDALAFAVLSNNRQANTTISIGGSNGAQNATLSIDGLLFVGQGQAQANDPATTTNITVNNAGRLSVRDLSVFSADRGYVSNLTVNAGGIAELGASAILSGGSETLATSLGGGTTNIVVSGGEVRAGSFELAGDTSSSVSLGAQTHLSVAGIGAKIVATGMDDSGTVALDGGYFVASKGNGEIGSDAARFALITIDVSSGGTIEANEAFLAGDTQDGSTLIQIDGAGSMLDAGGRFAVNDSARANSQVSINIASSGTLSAPGDSNGSAGAIVINAMPGSGNATITLAGNGSTLQSSGAIHLGGSPASGLGSPTTLNASAATAIVAASDLYLGGGSSMATAGRFDVVDSRIAGTWTINGGDANRMIRTGRMIIEGNGVITLAPSTPATPLLLLTRNIQIGASAKLDLGTNAMRIRPDEVGGMNLAQLKLLLLAGRKGNGLGGIGGSSIGSLALGYDLVDAAGTFLGTPTLPGDLLVRATLPGDADLNGLVDFDDLLTLAQNYDSTSGEWFTGDFNFDGSVNFDDLLSLAQNYGSSLLARGDSTAIASDWAMAQSMVPEPAAVTSTLMASVAMSFRSRRGSTDRLTTDCFASRRNHR